MASAYADGGVPAGKTFLGHPRGLVVLFFAEMWERFSFYGMRGLLILYLTKHWLFGADKANLIYGAYMSLVYITPLLGGYLADRYLGQRKAVVFGAVLLTFGHFLMAFEGSGGQHDPAIGVFWLALSFVIVGAGFLKANISVIVGQLYPLTDVRRDGAYTIFYVGVNVGATLGSIVSGALGEIYGWRYGFGAAGFGMLLGLLVFVVFRPALLGRGEAPDAAALRRPVAGVPLEWLLYAIGTASVVVIWAIIQVQEMVGWLLLIAGAAMLSYLVWVAVTRLDRHARDRILAIIFLLACQPVFWGLNEQGGGSLNLFTDSYVDRTLFGWQVPASIFQSVNPACIVIFGPVMAALWTMMARRGIEPSAPAKFGIGVLLNGLAFLFLVWGAEAAGVDAPTPVIWIFVLYLSQTIGELCLSPVGLSAMNRLAPRHMASLVMGAWFFMLAAGEFSAGLIGAAAGARASEGAGAAKPLVLHVYANIGWVGIAIGVAILVVAPFVERLMHLDTLSDVDHAIAGERQIGEPQAAGVDTRGELRP